DLQAEIARQIAGDAGDDHLVDARLGERRDGGERRHAVDQRGVDGGAADGIEAWVLVLAREVADRDLADELAAELEGGADLGVDPVRVALLAVAVELQVVHARVGADLDERLDARLEIVARAKGAAELVVVAVLVAGGLAVDEGRGLPDAAIDRGLGGEIEAVEGLRVADRRADRGGDRQARPGGLGVRAARRGGAGEQARLAGETGAAGSVTR